MSLPESLFIPLGISTETTFFLDLFMSSIANLNFPSTFLFNPIPNIQSKIISALFISF